jgi:hypothetical protein
VIVEQAENAYYGEMDIVNNTDCYDITSLLVCAPGRLNHAPTTGQPPANHRPATGRPQASYRPATGIYYGNLSNIYQPQAFIIVSLKYISATGIYYVNPSNIHKQQAFIMGISQIYISQRHLLWESLKYTQATGIYYGNL